MEYGSAETLRVTRKNCSLVNVFGTQLKPAYLLQWLQCCHYELNEVCGVQQSLDIGQAVGQVMSVLALEVINLLGIDSCCGWQGSQSLPSFGTCCITKGLGSLIVLLLYLLIL